MSIWTIVPTPEQLNQSTKDTMLEHLGIEFLEIGEDFIKARMPVDHRTVQPFGLLHGGASATLAESLGSVAANLCLEDGQNACVGLEINANHIRPATGGYVYGVTRPVHIGKATQVWEIHIYDEAEKLVCISRLTLAVIQR
jgi:1,4-dihydroxy-2-naphthoyl-CoA hydrolase